MSGELLPSIEGCEFTVTRPTLIDENNFTSNVPYYHAPAWDATKSYYPMALVYYDGLFYRRTTTGSSINASTPSSSPTLWTVVSDELLFAPWEIGTTYSEGDMVAVSYKLGTGGPTSAADNASDVYISKINSNLGNDPLSSPDEWQKIGTTYSELSLGRISGGVQDGGSSTFVGVRRIFNRRVYEALVDDPDSTLTSPVLSDWLDLGPANRWAMLDDLTNTQTTMPIDIVTSTQITGRVNTLGLLGLRGTSVNVTVMDGVTEVYNEDFPLASADEIVDWWTFFTSEKTYRSKLIISDLPINLNPEVTVTVTTGDGYGTRAIGQMVIGNAFVVGLTEKGSTVGIENYDRINTDEFGTRTIIRRGYADIGTFKVFIDNAKVDAVKRIMTDLRGTPSLYVASSVYDSTIYFGIASFDIGLEYANHARANISVNGY